jgi:hypothetical protein
MVVHSSCSSSNLTSRYPSSRYSLPTTRGSFEMPQMPLVFFIPNWHHPLGEDVSGDRFPRAKFGKPKKEETGMRKIVMAMVLGIAVMTTGNMALACATCGCGAKAAAPAAKVAAPACARCGICKLCKKCGQVAGSKLCCKEGAKTCKKCGLAKKSPGCCRIDKAAKGDIVVCKKCGQIAGSKKCCKKGAKICKKCNKVKKSPGCRIACKKGGCGVKGACRKAKAAKPCPADCSKPCCKK